MTRSTQLLSDWAPRLGSPTGLPDWAPGLGSQLLSDWAPGFLHAGISTAIVDTACGYAALTLMPAGAGVLTVEFKMNLLAPGQGELFVATGRVMKAGRTVTVCTGEVEALRDGERKPVALMQATMMSLLDRPDFVD